MNPDLFYVKSEDHKRHLSDSLKAFYAEGGQPWNKDKKGVQKPRVWTAEQRLALSNKFKGRKNSWAIASNKKHKTGQTLSQHRFHEVKGWMDARSKHKIEKLVSHYHCRLRVIGPMRMKSLGLIDRNGRIIKHAA